MPPSKVKLADLIAEGLIAPGTRLAWTRNYGKEHYEAVVLDTGAIELSDGRVYKTPSMAAKSAANVASVDGWIVWRLPSGETLAAVREKVNSR